MDHLVVPFPAAGAGLRFPTTVIRSQNARVKGVVDRRRLHLRSGEATREPLTLLSIFGPLVLALNVGLPMFNVWTVALNPDAYGSSIPYLIATALALPLHLRHVAAAMRGERPAGWRVTFAGLVAINLVAVIVLGWGALHNLVTVAVSGLVLCRGRSAAAVLAAVIVLPFILEHLIPV